MVFNEHEFPYKVLFSTTDSTTHLCNTQQSWYIGFCTPCSGSSLTVRSLSYPLPSSTLAHLPIDISSHDHLTSSSLYPNLTQSNSLILPASPISPTLDDDPPPSIVLE